MMSTSTAVVYNKAIGEEAYPTYSLEEVLAQAAGGFHAIVKNGYSGNIMGKEINTPPLEPLKPGTLSKKVETKHANVEFTLNDPVITGLNTIKLESISEIDYKNNMEFSVSLDFSKLELSCDDYDREGTFKLLFKDRDLTKLDRSLTLTLSDVSLNLTFNLIVTDAGVEVKVAEKDDNFEIGKMVASVEDSLIFNTLSPLFKDFIASAVSKNVNDLIANFLTDKINAIGKKQEGIVAMLDDIYKNKQRQGLLVDSQGNELKPKILQDVGEVGQLPYPMFWDLPSVPVDKLDHMTIADVVETGKTGDLLMFQGVADGSKIIRRFTQSPYSHNLMIIKEDDLFDGKPVLIQATSSQHFDLMHEKRIHGIQLNDIEENLVEYNGEWGLGSTYKENPARVGFRRLSMDQRSEEEEKKLSKALVSFIRETNGIAYAENMSMYSLYVAGLAEIDLEELNGRTYYCASFVAQALMEYGIITDEFVSQQYGPRDFSMKYNTLPFVHETTSYGPEIVVDLQ